MTPEEYQVLIDQGYNPAEIKAQFGEDPPAGWRATGATQATGTPAGPTQKPYGVSDWVWTQYMAAARDYDETWNDLKGAQYGIPDEALKLRANNAASLLAKAKAAVDAEVGKGTGQTAYSAGSTSSPYLIRQGTDGKLEKVDNPNYVPPREPAGRTRFPEEEEYDRLQAEKLRRELAGDIPMTPWQQAQLGLNQSELDYKREQDDVQRQQFEQQQDLARKQAAWRMASDELAQRIQIAPQALIPGQTHFLGYEPGGPWQANFAKLNLPFDPERFKVPVQTYDPQAAWQRAWGTVGGK